MRNKIKEKLKQGYRKSDLLYNYIYSDGKQALPMMHDGKDITKPLNRMRLAEFRKCRDCAEHPVLTIQFRNEGGNLRDLGVCMTHWGRLANSTIGWSLGSEKA